MWKLNIMLPSSMPKLVLQNLPKQLNCELMLKNILLSLMITISGMASDSSLQILSQSVRDQYWAERLYLTGSSPTH